MTNEQFQATVKEYLESSGISQIALAGKLGVSAQAISKWIHKGCVTEEGRAKVIQKHPEIFFRNGEQSEDLPSPAPQSLLCPLEKYAKESINPAQVSVKTEFARNYLASLSQILVWFLFQATSAERERFRDELGDDWKDFLSLTRAMTGETAFKITQQEGGLQKWGQRP